MRRPEFIVGPITSAGTAKAIDLVVPPALLALIVDGAISNRVNF